MAETVPPLDQDPAADGLNPQQQFNAELVAAAQSLDGLAVPTVEQFNQARALAQELEPSDTGYRSHGKFVNQEAAESVELTADPNRWEMDQDQEAEWRSVADAKHVADLSDGMRAHVGKVDVYEPGGSILDRARKEAGARLALHDQLKAEENQRKAEEAGRQAEAAQVEEGKRAEKMQSERQRVYEEEHARTMAKAARDIEAKVDAAVANIDRNNPDAMRLLESTRAKFRADFERQASGEAHSQASAAADAREAHINENGGIDNLDKINFKDRMGSGKGSAPEKTSDSRVNDNRSEESKSLERPEGVSFKDWYNASREQRAEMVARANVAEARANADPADTADPADPAKGPEPDKGGPKSAAELIAEADRQMEAERQFFAQLYEDLTSGDDARIAEGQRLLREMTDDTDHPERAEAFENYRQERSEQEDAERERAAAEAAAAAAVGEEVGEAARRAWSTAEGRDIIRRVMERLRANEAAAAAAAAGEGGGDDGAGPAGTAELPVVDPTPTGLRARWSRMVERARGYFGDEESGRRRRVTGVLLGAGALVGTGVGIFLASKGMTGVETMFGGPIPGFGGGKSGGGHETARHAAQQYGNMREGSNPWEVAKQYLVSHGNKHPSNAQIEAEDARIGRFYMAAHHLGEYSWNAWTKVADKLPVSRLRVK